MIAGDIHEMTMIQYLILVIFVLILETREDVCVQLSPGQNNRMHRYYISVFDWFLRHRLKGGGKVSQHDLNRSTLVVPQESKSIMDGIGVKGIGLRKIIIQRGSRDHDRKIYIRQPGILEIIGESSEDDCSEDSDNSLLNPTVRHTQANLSALSCDYCIYSSVHSSFFSFLT